ncbi:MAG: glucose-1-phosphate thymidylyltransferase [Chloroflexota bacterium]
MKGLILCGGKGTQLRPLTYTTPKQLLPVANRPIAFEVIRRVAEVGIEQAGVIVSPETGHLLMEAIGDGSHWGISLTYITQSEPAGLAHAVKVARPFLADSPFLMLLGDNLFEEDLHEPLARFRNDSPAALLVLKQVPDPRRFGVAELDSKGCCVRLQEKPKSPRTDLAITGAYFFSPAIHDAILRIRPSWRNELEITDAIQELVNMGHTVLGHVLQGWWLDTGTREAMLHANQLALERIPSGKAKGDIRGHSRIEGTVELETGAVVEDSLLLGPVSIQTGCQVKSSTVGPYVSIAAASIVEGSHVDNSIILDNCSIKGVGLLSHSIVGRNSKVLGEAGTTASLLLGDHSVVELQRTKEGRG